jgi:hypothetical protein
MNGEKAREYFSSYREGSLEGGLRQTFEHKLKTDRQIKAEYDAFVLAIDDLDLVKYEEIPIPVYLNARIHDRLDEARKPAKQERGLIFYLPRFGIAAAAAVAIIFAANNIFHPSQSNFSGPSQAGLIPGGSSEPAPSTTWPSESIGVEPGVRSVQVHYSSANDRTVTVKDGTGTVLQNYVLKAGEPLKAELKNSNTEGAVFEVTVSDGGPDEFIAVPGSTQVTQIGQQSGTVLEFEKALADRYGKPVIFAGKDTSVALSWNLVQDNANAASDQVLEGTKLVGTITNNDVLSITDRQ